MASRRKSEYSREELRELKDFAADMQYIFGPGNIIKGLMGYAFPLTDEDRRRQRQPECLIRDEDDVVVDFSEDVEIASVSTAETDTGSLL